MNRPFQIAFLLVMLALWPLAAISAPCAGFDDVSDADPFCPAIAWIKNQRITFGCAPSAYCPNDPVLRSQMAAFLSRLESLLPAMVVDANGRVLGPYISPNQISFRTLYRTNGESILLYLISYPNSLREAPPFAIVGMNLFYDQPGCTGNAYVLDIGFPLAGTRLGSVKNLGAEQHLYVTDPFPLSPETIAAKSVWAGGTCTATISPTTDSLVAVHFLEDLAAKFTGPFNVR